MLKISRFPASIKTFGNSMFPLLHNEDIVFLTKIQFTKIKTNDIICVKKKGKIFTHRVIFRGEKHVITKGDNNLISDGKIYSKNILGVIYKVKRNRQIFGIADLYLFQSTIYFQEIIKAKNAFMKGTIDFLILKGLPLHMYFEGVHPKRVYADCDILVSKKDFPKINKILNKLGYRIEIPVSVTGKRLKNKAEISFVKILNGFPVIFDIHVELVFLMTRFGDVNTLYPHNYVKALTNKFLEEKINISVNNQTIKILNNENLFVYLCLHLFNHNFKGAYRYDFLNKLLERDIDILKVVEVVDRFRLRNFIYPTLIILKKYYKQKRVDEIIKFIKPEKKISKFIHKLTEEINIFDDGDIVGQGKHFKLLFFLSPNPIWKRILVFFSPKAIYTISWVIMKNFRKNLFRRTLLYKVE